MVVDIFLQFVGASTTGITVVGESVDKAHPETIVVNAVDFSVENPTTIGSMSAGAGAGKVNIQPPFDRSPLVDDLVVDGLAGVSINR